MTVENIIAIAIIGSVVGYIASILFNTGNFSLIVNVITGILGAVLAGSLIPNTLLINPIIEYFIRAVVGATVFLLIMALIRRV